MRFPLGTLFVTPGALEHLSAAGVSPLALVARHARCDWSELPSDDRDANLHALATGARLLSAYAVPAGSPERVWIITEADRSTTTVLLPDEY